MVTLHRFWPRSPREVEVIGYACLNSCGGWADRQKGIVGAFVLAAILGKEFKIHMPVPCELTYFLFPPQGHLDWRLKPGELQSPGSRVTWLRHINHRSLQFAKELVYQDKLEEMFDTMTADYVFLTTNMEIVHILRQHRLAQDISWLQEQTIPEIYHTVLTQLFALMAGPQLILDNFWRSVPPRAHLICAQIRVGGIGDSESFNTIQDFSGLASFLAPYNVSSTSLASSFSSTKQYRFLFTSDKAFMLEHAQRLFPTLYVGLSGPITHVDHIKGGSTVCGGLARVIVEQLALSKCHVLIMSESGFARIASFLRNTDDNLFLFHDGLVERTSRDTTFPNRPSW
ncbi:hypothetical protein ACOMHN_056402 [Nucella lapillus]